MRSLRVPSGRHGALSVWCIASSELPEGGGWRGLPSSSSSSSSVLLDMADRIKRKKREGRREGSDQDLCSVVWYHYSELNWCDDLISLMTARTWHVSTSRRVCQDWSLQILPSLVQSKKSQVVSFEELVPVCTVGGLIEQFYCSVSIHRTCFSTTTTLSGTFLEAPFFVYVSLQKSFKPWRLSTRTFVHVSTAESLM